MSRIESLLLIPEATRLALHRRIIASGFSGYDAHARWLADQGHKVSRSSIHRYINARRLEIYLDAGNPHAAVAADLRMRALEIARTLPGPEPITDKADQLLRYLAGP